MSTALLFASNALDYHSGKSLPIKLSLRGHILRISDTVFYFDNGIEVELEPGEYHILELRDVAALWTGIDVIRTNDFDDITYIDELGISFSQLGLFDKGSVDSRFESIPDMSMYHSQLNNSLQFGLIDLGQDVLIPFFRCEEGVGQVYKLQFHGVVVGVRLLFGYLEDEV